MQRPRGGDDPFAGAAEHFDRRPPVAPGDPMWQSIAPLASNGTVIEVGAGTGRWTVPLASIATSVVAVEPSPAMCQRLVAHTRSLPNVRVMPTTFAAADLEPADLVMAADVIQLVADAVNFVRKADALARRAVALVVHFDRPGPPFMALWERYRADPPPSFPGFADLYNLLLALGIKADIVFGRGMAADQLPDAAAIRAQASRFFGTEVSQDDATWLAARLRQRGHEVLVTWSKE